MKSFSVASHAGSYKVSFFESVSNLLGQFRGSSNLMFIIDRNVHELYPALKEVTSQFPCYLLEAKEETKSFKGLEEICCWLQDQKANKKTKLVIVGGGITQDVGAFATAIYYRGLDWILIPTTLLSMADSCIGSKCGINLRESKNQLGLFYAPKEIYICPEFRKTLSQDDVESGHGEILKLSLTKTVDNFEKYKAEIQEDGFGTRFLLDQLHRSLLVKKTLIEEDEFDVGPRRLLNYGHTFGHALEAVTHNRVNHGQAVVFGMDLMNYISLKTGRLDQKTYDVVSSIIRKFFNVKCPEKIEAKALVQHVLRDKKVVGMTATFSMLTGPSKLELVQMSINPELEMMVSEYLEKFSILK